jgi:sortase A
MGLNGDKPDVAPPSSAPAAETPPARLVVPAIAIDTEVVPVGSQEVVRDGRVYRVWDVASYAAGWHNDSSLPGQGDNVVIAGHNNIQGEVFRHLAELSAGDKITLYADGRAFEYVVEYRFILPERGVDPEIRAQNARWIGSFGDERLTLLSCWPHWSNTHRVIVVASPTF